MTDAYLAYSICRQCKKMFDMFVRDPTKEDKGFFVNPDQCPYCSSFVGLDRFV